MTAPAEHPPLARALGRIPCGLYIVSSELDGTPVGFLGSFVMQAGFEPPTISVAVGKDRDHLRAMRESGRFAVSILDEGSSGLMSGFFRAPAEGQTHFDPLETETTQAGSIVLSDALGWIDCEVTGEFETGDHVVVYGVVREASLAREGDPKVHLRKNGLSY